MYPHDLLLNVEQPGQYVGGEHNAIVKNWDKAEVRAVLCYPDTYALGMSHLGLKILYHIINERPDALAERAFAPWFDMELELRQRHLPLCSLENNKPLREFDFIGISLQYELTYTNILNMLDLAGLPLSAAERTETFPLVIGGGPGALNPEPLAEFFDAFILGDGEASLPPLIDEIKRMKKNPRLKKRDALLELSRSVPGFYAPALYDVRYNEDGTIAEIKAQEGAPAVVNKALIPDLEDAPYPTKFIVPTVQAVHDRLAVEVMRGCSNACRFCHAGMTYRPRRVRSVEKIMELARAGYAATGYEEVGLLSLSTCDYPEVRQLLQSVSDEFSPKKVNISLPSLRVGEALAEIPKAISAVRKSGLTIAPEAGSERLRRSINKDISNEQLFAGTKAAFAAGWNLVKLYFMIGLPGETPEDHKAIVDIAYQISRLRREVGGRPADVNLSVASFVPKPHTPFQWEPMATREYLESAQNELRKMVRPGHVMLKMHELDSSQLEGVFSRGDRRLSKVLREAWKRGLLFCAWNEHSRPNDWKKVFADLNIDTDFYTSRQRSENEIFPWEHLNAGLSREFLLRELRASQAGTTTPPCSEEFCADCGLRNLLGKECPRK